MALQVLSTFSDRMPSFDAFSPIYMPFHAHFCSQKFEDPKNVQKMSYSEFRWGGYRLSMLILSKKHFF
jgi:hypothetical protein